MAFFDFLKGIGDFFSHIFDGANKTWKHLEPDIKDALIHGSGIINAINTNLQATPEFILDLIKNRFPYLPVDKIKDGLNTVALDLKIVEDAVQDDLLVTLKNIQDFLSKQEGTAWEKASSIMSQVLSVFLAPEGTKFAVIVSLIEYVYRKIIKKEE